MTRKAKDIFLRAEKIKAALASAQAQPLPVEDVPSKSYSDELRDRILKDTAVGTAEEKLTWDDVAGLEPVKAALNEAVILPKKFPQLFSGKRVPSRGVLMYGPPGTGKTYIARVLASMAGMKFFSVSASTLVSKYVGEGEKMVKELFRLAEENRPSVIFIDEIDSVLSRRSDDEHEASRRLKTEFFIRMQEVIDRNGSDPSVLVLAATNRPWDLDPAALRRFEKRIYVPEPDLAAREKLLEVSLKGERTTLRKETLRRIAEKTEGYSGADIATIAREALMIPVREAISASYFCPVDGDPANPETFVYAPCTSDFPGAEKMTIFELPQNSLFIPPVSEDYLEKALTNVKPSVNPGEIARFTEWTEKYGQAQKESDKKESDQNAEFSQSSYSDKHSNNDKDETESCDKDMEMEMEDSEDDDDVFDEPSDKKSKQKRSVGVLC